MNIRPFQIVLFIIFGISGIVALILLTRFNGSSGGEVAGRFGESVEVWGPFPSSEMNDVFEQITLNSTYAFEVVKYKQVDPTSFHNQFINAIAEGRSPDLVILPHSELTAQRSKLIPIEYGTEGFSERDLRDRFVDGAELFYYPEGAYAVPLAVDPLILYWNRDAFANKGFAAAPTTWGDITGNIVNNFTVRDNNRNIIQSAIALGEYTNIRNAEAILALLAIQSGSKMVTRSNAGYEIEINKLISGDGRPPLSAAIDFYTQFSSPASPLYSWSRGQGEDRQLFTSGDLVMYFGYSSEYDDIQKRNPNLNFDVAMVPQGAGSTARRTYGTFFGLAIPKASDNVSGAFAAASYITQDTYAAMIQDSFYLAPAQRTLTAKTDTSAYRAIFNKSALIARGWLQPSPTATAAAIKTLVEDVVSSRLSVSDAIADFIIRIQNSY